MAAVPLEFAYYNRPGEASATTDARVSAMAAPTIFAVRKEHPHTRGQSFVRFEAFDGSEPAVRRILALPPHERCYYAIVDACRPIELYFDAEIRPDQLRMLDEPGWLSFDAQIVFLALWLRCMIEALSGVPMPRGGAWLWRADRENKYSCHGHFPHCVFETIDILSSYMRVLEDTVYANRSQLWAARILCFCDAGRTSRRRPACISQPSLVVSPEEELVCDMGVYSRVRQMRMPLNRTRPSTSNPLVLWQPSGVAVDEAVASQTPIDVYASRQPAHITAGDAMRVGSICPPEAALCTRRPALPDVVAWEHLVNECASKIATVTDDTTRSQLTALIADTWCVFVDRHSQPRSLCNLADTCLALERLLPTAAIIADPERRAVARWRTVWWIALAVRWCCPTGQRRVVAMDTARLVAAATQYLDPLVRSYARVDVPDTLEEALAVLKIVHSPYNAALVARLDMSWYAMHGAASRFARQVHAGALSPIQVWQVVTTVLPLLVAAAYAQGARPSALEPDASAEPLAMDTLAALRAVDTLELFSDTPDQVYTLLLQAVVHGPMWYAPMHFIARELSAQGATGATRFSARPSSTPADSHAALATIDHNFIDPDSSTVGASQSTAAQSPESGTFHKPPGTFEQPGWIPA